MNSRTEEQKNLLKSPKFYCLFNLQKADFDPVYTRAKDSGFVPNPGCFVIGFVLPFALRNMKQRQNYHRQIINPELSKPEKFVRSLYPKKFESDKTSPVNSFRKEFRERALPYGFQMYCH